MLYLRDLSILIACLSLPSLVSKMDMRLFLLCMHCAMSSCSTADTSLGSKISASGMCKLSSDFLFLHFPSTASASRLHSLVIIYSFGKEKDYGGSNIIVKPVYRYSIIVVPYKARRNTMMNAYLVSRNDHGRSQWRIDGT